MATQPPPRGPSVSDASRLVVTLLGGFEARVGGEVVRLPTKKSEALLAYLAVRPGYAHQRDKLAALLWGDTADEQARGSLRQALSLLGKAVAGTRPPCLLAEGRTVTLVAAAVDVDVARFEAAAAGTPQALEQAAALYQADLLQGLTLNESALEEWLLSERERLREKAMDALMKLLAYHQGPKGSVERAIQTAVRLLALDPCQEACIVRSCGCTAARHGTAPRSASTRSASPRCSASHEGIALAAAPDLRGEVGHGGLARSRLGERFHQRRRLRGGQRRERHRRQGGMAAQLVERQAQRAARDRRLRAARPSSSA